MKLIEKPATLTERIVNAVVANIYGRSGGDYWFDGIDDDVRDNELVPELVEVVQRELADVRLVAEFARAYSKSELSDVGQAISRLLE